ncbi:MAG: glycosyltransferase family 4 protein [Hyphomicrobiales bacterium]|nr:glycosyltransferase family 4 protein [Hyphomicrobiales bacterium]
MKATAPRKLTVLQVIPQLHAGGAELGCLQVADALVAAGHRAIVVSEGGRMVEALRRAGGEHVTLPVASKNPLAMVLNIGRLARLIRRESVDIVHARSRAPAWSSYFAARRAGAVFMTTHHASHEESGALKRLYNSVMVRGAAVIAVSDWVAGLIRRRYGIPEERIHVIHRSVDPERFDPDAVGAARIQALAKAWGTGPDDLVVLLPGRISRRKGHMILIDAVAGLEPDLRRRVRLVFAGDDQPKSAFRDGLERHIAARGLHAQVTFAGHVSDMPAAYSLAMICVLAMTAPEGFPRVMLEAQAMGTPVIVADVGPGREVVRAPPQVPTDAASGLTFPAGDAAALGRCLEQILRMPEAKRRAMGARGSEWVRSTFTLKRLTEATLALYGNLAARQGRLLT